MKNHVLRPLFVALGVIALILVVRAIMVPSDFGVHGDSFTYNFFRQGSIDDWRNFKVKYQGKEYCAECHDEQVEAISGSPHAIIECENCHGPAVDHPDNPETLTIDRSRAQCLRCHAALPYPSSQRAEIVGIDPDDHNGSLECAGCHNPHTTELREDQ